MSEYLTDLSKPVPVDGLDMAFGVDAKRLMPAMDSIPEEYQSHYGGKDPRAKKYHDLFNDWFFGGLEKLEFKMADGIDETLMKRHIKSIMGSFEPQHEHKEAAVAYLLSLWTKDVKWKRKK